MKELKIGSVRLKNRFLLAPMVDVTDLAYRQICREHGAGMAYTEMLNIGAILHTNVKTQRLMKTNKFDKPSGIQITGPRVDEFRKVAPYLKDFDIVDINCGCPSIRITDNASGSYLLRTPKKIGNYIRVLKEQGYTTTAKIRLGFKKNNVLTIAKEIERAGADAITVHARLSTHSYKVPADWSWIAKVKKNVGIPVIGNGDIMNGEKAMQMLDICDGAMISRAAIGDPLIFERLLYYERTGKEMNVDSNYVKRKINSFSKYLALADKYEIVDMPRIKSLGGNFISGFNGAAKLRNEWMKVKNLREAEEFVSTINSSG